MKELKNIGRNVSRLRARLSLSQAELARMIHKSQCSIAHLETGQVSTDIETIEKIAQALKVDTISLLMKRCKPIRRGRKGPRPSEVVGDNLTLMRLATLTTQAKLSKLTGVKQGNISSIERNREGNIRLTTLGRFAKALRLKSIIPMLEKPAATVLRIRKYVKIAGAGPSHVPANMRNGVYTWRGYQAV
jgi:transcriptional regulator with XRE-family HTH domain